MEAQHDARLAEANDYHERQKQKRENKSKGVYTRVGDKIVLKTKTDKGTFTVYVGKASNKDLAALIGKKS
jgi:hypothetical protein